MDETNVGVSYQSDLSKNLSDKGVIHCHLLIDKEFLRGIIFTCKLLLEKKCYSNVVIVSAGEIVDIPSTTQGKECLDRYIICINSTFASSDKLDFFKGISTAFSWFYPSKKPKYCYDRFKIKVVNI